MGGDKMLRKLSFILKLGYVGGFVLCLECRNFIVIGHIQLTP